MAKAIMNLKGSYSRWDILSLKIRESPYEPITTMEGTGYGHDEKSPAEVEIFTARVRKLERNLPAIQRGKTQ